jgi:hypothetical protein
MDDPAPSWALSLCPKACPKEKGAGRTCEQILLRYITSTVASDSWQSVGGVGNVQFFPLGMALVVIQTPEVQEEVAALLLKLRRLQRELDKEYTLELTWVEGQGNDQTRLQFPRVTACQTRWFSVMHSDGLDVGNGTIRDVARRAGHELRPCSADDSTREPNVVQTGHTYRGRMTPVEKGRIRLDLELQRAELDEVNREGLVVAGQAYRIVRLVQPGQAAKVVLQRDADGRPQSWLDLTITEPAQEEDEETIFLGETPPTPR